MKTISDVSSHNSLLGHIYEDIWFYLRGMQHSLARYAKNLSDEMYWLEDSPPPAVEALYQDSLHINERLIVLL